MAGFATRAKFPSVMDEGRPCTISNHDTPAQGSLRCTNTSPSSACCFFCGQRWAHILLAAWAQLSNGGAQGGEMDVCAEPRCLSSGTAGPVAGLQSER